MSEMEDKLNSILSNPAMMQQLMAMAQSMNQPPVTGSDTPPSKSEVMPEIDLSMLQKLSGLAQNGNIDRNQKTLLSALKPYLSRERIGKLEKAMRAAKMAQFASGFLGGQQLQSGR